MAEDLGQEDVVGLVFGFELVAADSSVGAAQVAGFPGFVQGAESMGNVLRQPEFSTPLGKVLLVSPFPRLECLLAAFHDGEHRVDDSGIVDTSRT